MTDPVSGSVRIGTYALEVGTFTESYAAFEPEREDQNVTALHDALAEEAGDVRTPVAALEKLEANAEVVTRKCERAHELSRAAAEGRLLEADAVIGEVDSLLRLAERLDRDGRFDEELRLLRALHGLLVLVRRWLDLIRVLRRALSAAEESGDLAAEAWARHELGSLQLCAGEPEAAGEQLGRALRLQQRLGQTAGACATRHNLDSAQRDLAKRAASKPWSRRRLPRLAVAAGALTLLTIAGTGMAVALDDDSPSLTEPTTTTPTTAPSDTTTPTTAPSDTTTPTTAPSDTTTPTTAPSDTTRPVLFLTCDDLFNSDTLTIDCTLTSTDAGTARFEFTEIQFVLAEEERVENSVKSDQTVELQPDTPRTFSLTLPHEDLGRGDTTILAFVVVAVQTDAAGNSGSSPPEQTAQAL
jgi:hypothetical protein